MLRCENLLSVPRGLVSNALFSNPNAHIVYFTMANHTCGIEPQSAESNTSNISSDSSRHVGFLRIFRDANGLY